MSISSRQVPLPDTLQAARSALMAPVRAIQTPTGKRVLVALAVAGSLQAGVAALYGNADAPAVSSTAVATIAPAAVPAEPATSEPEAAAQAAEERPAAPDAKAAAAGPTDKPVRPSPEDAAVAFYAVELGVEEARIRPLAQERVNDNTVKVLVLAQRGAEDLDTRHIQVNRTQSGWRVP